MKDETRNYYQKVVRVAATRIVHGLDEALDLASLARTAALSPLHFHRIFRGMIGETPLELHRRLRLERAAYRLARERDVAVTTVAFQAGYETHESFTRSFRDAFGCTPSELRDRARAARDASGRVPPTELAARSGIHFTDRLPKELPLTFSRGEITMHVAIEELPEMRVGAVTHRGPYDRIAEAFGRLGFIAERDHLVDPERTAMVAIYYDDPEAKPASELRSEAGISLPEGAPMPNDLVEARIPAGRYARTTHVGPYSGLGDAWVRLVGEWLPQSGHRVGDGVSFERYRNTPMNAAPHELCTDLYVPLADE